MAKDASGPATHQFPSIAILLLLHQTRSLVDRVTHLNKPDLAGAIKNDVFCQSRQVHHDHRRCTYKLDYEITIAHGIQAVSRDRLKAESLGYGGTIDRSEEH